MTDYYLKLTASEIDGSLDDAREPDAHAASHKSGGSDAIKLNELAAPDNVTTLNATTTRPGLLKTLSNVSTEFMNGVGEWATPAGGDGGGLTYPGSSTVFLNGNGAFTIPSASGSVFKPWVTVGTTGSGADYVCDGTADNVQFQAAVDAVPDGGTILVLEGDYACSSKVYKYGKSFTMEGVGTVNITFSTTAAAANGFDFRGTTISYGSVTMSTATKGAISIVVSSVSSAAVGDILHIYEDVLWTPLDANQQTGEIYTIQSISGTTITLNEPLLRTYNSGDSPIVSYYRPVEIHIKNINVTMASGTLNHTALTLKMVSNSSIEGCIIRDAGMMGIASYNSFNVEIMHNKIYNCIMTGSGYGISSWSGDAYIDIHDNYVEKCRHCISVNSDSTDVLSRRIFIHDNFIIGGIANGSHPVDAHQQMIDLIVQDNIIVPQADYYSMITGARYTVFKNNKCYGGEGGVCTRGDVHDKVMVITDNQIYPLAGHGYLYRGYGSGIGEKIEITGNYIDDCNYGVMFNDDSDEGESYRNMIIKNNHISDVNYDGIVIKANTANVVANISNNHISGCGGDGIYLDSNSNSFSFVTISNNVIHDPNVNSSGGSGICIVNSSYSMIDGNKIYDSNTHAGYGVRTTGTSDYTVAIGNIARGMSGTKFTLAGSNNVTTPANISL